MNAIHFLPKPNSIFFLLMSSLLMPFICPSVLNAQFVDENAALAKSLDAISDAGEKWIKDRGCVSCHQVPSLIWSHQVAREAGISIPEQELESWITWSADVVNFVKPDQKKEVDHSATMTGNVDTMIALLLAMPDFRPDPNEKPELAGWKKSFLTKLVELQADDGSWKACGQLPLQKRPEKETHAVTTLWATYVLQLNNEDFARDKAIQFADAIEKAESTEWWAVRLLVANQQASAKVKELLGELLSRQNDDGGWGFLCKDNSDALGTGYALYALSKLSDDQQPELAQSIRLAIKLAIKQAREFLFSSQGADGKWQVAGTKNATKGRTTPTATDWGTAWAVIGLVESRKENRN